jgi:hypothetical protein
VGRHAGPREHSNRVPVRAVVVVVALLVWTVAVAAATFGVLVWVDAPGNRTRLTWHASSRLTSHR